MTWEVASLEPQARERFQREWEALSHEWTEAADGGTGCPALWVLPELLNLVCEQRDRPVQEMTPMVRRLIVEQSFVDENGDSIFDARARSQVEKQVEVIVRVLESIRQEALSDGRWSNVPLADMMYG